jgi:hypothetical protein
MATIVTKIIGTGGDYPDPAAWFAAAPASLVAADQIWQGKLKKQKFSSATTLDITGKGVDATHYFELTTDTGASFRDDAGAATNPLRADETKGAMIEVTGGARAINIDLPYTRISRLQIVSTDQSANALPVLKCTSNTTGVDINQCLLVGYSINSAENHLVRMYGANTLRNSVAVQRKAVATAIIIDASNGASLRNVTAVATGGVPLNFGIKTQYLAATLENVYVGGVTAPEDGISAPSRTKCYSSGAGAGYTLVPFDATTFQSVTDGASDWRLKVPGSSLIGVGVTDATYGATDIMGTARPAGAYDIGAWQSPAAPDTVGPTLINPTSMSTGTTTGTASVSTNEANGTLRTLFTTNATEVLATIKASGAAQAVTALGVQTVPASALAPSTTYYPHHLHTDAAGNDSNVLNGLSFTTSAPGDTTPPDLSLPTATATGATTGTGTVNTTEAGGALYYYVSTNAIESGPTIKAANKFAAVTATGQQTVLFTGLPPSTTLYAHYIQPDASGNDSNVVHSASFTTPAASSGTLATKPFKNGSGTVQAGLSGLKVTVLTLNPVTLVKTITTGTTDGAGVNTISDAAIIAGTTYQHVTTNAAGTVIGAELITAT